MKHVSILLLFLIPGCTDLMPGIPAEALPALTRTPATAWTDAKARYSDSQHAAAEYAVRCDRDLEMSMTRCRDTVDQLYELDQLAKLVQEDGDDAAAGYDTTKLSQAIKDLRQIASEMDISLRRQQTKELIP